MKNQYMFFKEQLFDGFDLSDYKKRNINIPNTDVHIYEFECIDSEKNLDDEEKAKKLDQLSKRISDKYADLYKIVSSESSQYFCEKIYPLIVKIETKLRYALYVSRALFEDGNVDKNSFKIGQKIKKEMEETDFGEIYEAVFTDSDLQGKVKEINGQKLTKADLIKKVESVEENTLWDQIVGANYNYIVEHFLEIKNYRNDVMHNHLLTYKQYIREQKVLNRAIEEFDKVINDKLLTNHSSYSNKTNIMDVLGGMLVLVGTAAVAINKFMYSEKGQSLIKGLEVIGTAVEKNTLLLDDVEKEVGGDLEK
jgi:hypothetical protein